MIVKAKSNKRMECGVHLLSIRGIERALEASTRVPVERTDASGEIYGALDITLSDAQNALIKERFWLGPKEQWMIDSLATAVGVDNSKGAVEAKIVIGRKFIGIVTKNLMYDSMNPRMDGAEQAWFPKLLMKFFPEGTSPNISMGELIRHYDSVAGEFTPQADFFTAVDEEENCEWI